MVVIKGKLLTGELAKKRGLLDNEFETFITSITLLIEHRIPSFKSFMENFSFIRRLSQLGTLMQTWFCGVKAGTDAFGNVYYHERKTTEGFRERRWVIYAGEPEASKVPPEWHIWLHHTLDAPIPDQSPFRKSWQKPHQQNLTGTPEAYLPPGHVLEGGKRAKATGDYEAWQPEL